MKRNSYINKEGWIYDWSESDKRYLSRQMTNIRHNKDGSFTVTGWYPLLYSQEQADKYLKVYEEE